MILYIYIYIDFLYYYLLSYNYIYIINYYFIIKKFKRNDNDISTWGIALYGPKGYIAVSANNFLIKMFKILKVNSNSKLENEGKNEISLSQNNKNEENHNNKMDENNNENIENTNLEISNLDGEKMSDSEISFEENFKDINKPSGKPIENHSEYLLGDECMYFKGHKHNIPYISFSKDGKYLISSSIGIINIFFKHL